MITTQLSSKGQVVIPKSIRDTHHWGEGTEFIVEEMEGFIVLKPTKPFTTTRLEDVIGCAGYKGPKKSLKDMERGIAAAIRKRYS